LVGTTTGVDGKYLVGGNVTVERTGITGIVFYNVDGTVDGNLWLFTITIELKVAIVTYGTVLGTANVGTATGFVGNSSWGGKWTVERAGTVGMVTPLIDDEILWESTITIDGYPGTVMKGTDVGTLVIGTAIGEYGNGVEILERGGIDVTTTGGKAGVVGTDTKPGKYLVGIFVGMIVVCVG